MTQKIRLTKSMTASELNAFIAEKSSETKKTVENVLGALADAVVLHIEQGLPITLLRRMIKIDVRERKASDAREVPNPFTGKMTKYPAQPARKVPAVKMLKALKDIKVESK